MRGKSFAKEHPATCAWYVLRMRARLFLSLLLVVLCLTWHAAPALAHYGNGVLREFGQHVAQRWLPAATTCVDFVFRLNDAGRIQDLEFLNSNAGPVIRAELQDSIDSFATEMTDAEPAHVWYRVKFRGKSLIVASVMDTRYAPAGLSSITKPFDAGSVAGHPSTGTAVNVLTYFWPDEMQVGMGPSQNLWCPEQRPKLHLLMPLSPALIQFDSSPRKPRKREGVSLQTFNKVIVDTSARVMLQPFPLSFFPPNLLRIAP